MNYRFIPLLLTAAFSLNACYEYQSAPSPEPLSVDLLELSSKLHKSVDCTQRKATLLEWMNENAKTVQNHKQSFDKACKNNVPSDVSCMSLQLLASGGVEVELRDCIEDADIAAQVERLNQIAGTAILKAK